MTRYEVWISNIWGAWARCKVFRYRWQAHLYARLAWRPSWSDVKIEKDVYDCEDPEGPQGAR